MPEVIKINKKIINPKQATGWETSERIEGETSFEIRICNKNTTMPIILHKHYPFFYFLLRKKKFQYKYISNNNSVFEKQMSVAEGKS